VTSLLISGLPAAGKSTFCAWLALEHGFVHVETDVLFGRDPVVNALAAPDPRTAASAATALMERGPEVALEWGFRPSLLPQVQAVIGAGFDPWWLGGSEPAARRSYGKRTQREAGAMRAFEVQVAAIGAAWDSIARVFDGRVLSAIELGPTYMSHEQIYETIVSRSG
jgi:hypothetical protein